MSSTILGPQGYNPFLPASKAPSTTQKSGDDTNSLIQGLSYLYQNAPKGTVRTLASAALGYALTSNTTVSAVSAVAGYFFPYILEKLSPSQPVLKIGDRENKIQVGAANIQTRLAGALQNAAKQMAQEGLNAFKYLNAISTFPGHPQQGHVGPYETGVCHAQGRRPTMEDEHLASSFALDIQGKKYPIQLFGIFDGHGGPDVSKFVKQHLANEVNAALKQHNPNGLTDEGIWNALKMACVSLDKKIPSKWANQGSTGTIAMILDGKLWTANVGDSRTVLDQAGTPVQLSEDAKPGDARYEKGIKNRNGVVMNGLPPRVNGILAVARAFGDHGLNGAVSARPKITMLPLKSIPKESHLVLCCDGVWDVASTAQVVKAVHANRNESPATLAKNIVYSALLAGSTDNLSAMVVKLP